MRKISKNIKGITVEINGEVGPLQKALGGVNKTSRDLQGELRDVERLLKLDPKNTILLEQKQKLLADSVTNTADKLETLKKAEEQAQKKFAEGKISEEQYRALKREVIKTETSLKHFKGQLEKVGTEIKETDTKVDKLGDAFKEAGKKAKKLGEDIGKGLAKGSAVGVAAIGALVTGSQEYNQDLARLRTNADLAGADLGIVEDAFMQITSVTGEADSAVETVSQLLATGFSDNQLSGMIDEINGAAIKFSDTLKTEGIADGIQETFTTGEATGSFAELLERSSVDLETFNEGLVKAQEEGEGTNYIMQTMSELGFGDVLDKYKELNPEVQANAEANADMKKSLSDLSIILTPLVTMVTDYITKMVEWVQKNPELATTIATITGVIAALSAIFFAIMPIVNGVIALWPLLAAGFGMITAPVAIVIAIIAAVIAIGVLLWKNWDTVIVKAKEFGVNISAKFSEIKTSVVNKVTEMKTAATNKINEMKTGTINKINEMKNGFTTKVGEIKTAVVNKFNEIKTGVSTRINSLKNDAINKFTSVVSSAKTKFNAVKNAILNPINTAKRKVKSAVDTIKGYFTGMKLNLPKIKVPRFSLKNWSINPVNWIKNMPSIGVNWNAKGALFTKPTIFNTPMGLQGFGEAGAEAALPLTDKVLGTIGESIAKLMPQQSKNYNGQPIILQTILNGRVIAEEIHSDIGQLMGGRTNLNYAMKGV